MKKMDFDTIKNLTMFGMALIITVSTIHSQKKDDQSLFGN